MANRQHGIISAIFRELRERDLQDALLPLLESQDRDVRAWAAAHALTFAPDKGRRVLEHLSKESGIVALEAEMTLREWRAGRLKFP